MYKKHKKTISIFLCFLLVFLQSNIAVAWSQDTHEAINANAIRTFINNFREHDKYKMGPITADGINDELPGIKVTSSTWFFEPRYGTQIYAGRYNMEEDKGKMFAWIQKGGDWADEPHVYMSIRHFYDPTEGSDSNHLTDMEGYTSWYESPNIDARTWGIKHYDNPFSFNNALNYYKNAMETPETELERNVSITDDHIRLISLEPEDREEERKMYLALAYRALGETMHMLGDMTQPAHVRNDAHPWDEPVEDNIDADDVLNLVRDGTAVVPDSRIGKFLMSAGAEDVLDPEDLFREVALFVNRYFYTSDTIYDEERGILPANEMKKYSKPQFKDLEVHELELNDIRRRDDYIEHAPGHTTVKTIVSGLFYDGNTRVPMAINTLSKSVGWIFGESVSETGFFTPPRYAKPQGQVLLPIAIYANADLMHLFFPTLELGADYQDMGLQEEILDGRDEYKRRVIEIESEMIHHQDKDDAWKNADLMIDYSGPGSILIENNGGIRKKIELHYMDGDIHKIEQHNSEMVEVGDNSIEFYLTDDMTMELTEEESYYQILDGDKLHILVEAGSRKFNAPNLIYQFAGESIEASYSDRGIVEQESGGEHGEELGGIREISVDAEVVNSEIPENTLEEVYLETSYTGPAELVFEREGRKLRTVPLRFKDGKLTQIMSPEEEMVEKELIIYVDESIEETELTEEEELYLVNPGEEVYLEIESWNKRLISERWVDEKVDEDIEGSYFGYINIEEANKIREYFVKVFTYMGIAVARVFGNDISYDEMRVVVENSITSETIGENIEFYLNIVKIEDDKYQIEGNIKGDTDYTASTAIGTYENNILTFEIDYYEDGTSIELKGRLRDENTLSGSFTITAWGIIKDGATGTWEVVRE